MHMHMCAALAGNKRICTHATVKLTPRAYMYATKFALISFKVIIADSLFNFYAPN